MAIESANRPSAWKDPGEEAALVSRAQRGDRAAFMALLRYYSRSVHRIIYALVRDPEKTAGLTHETFLRAWRGIQHIPAGQSFYPWLTRLARGLAIAHARRRTPATEPAVRDLPGAAAPGGGDGAGAAGGVDPERARACENAFIDLGIDYQTILILRVAEQLTYPEIAKTLDIPMGATLSRLASARAALRARLTEPHEKAA